MNIYLVDRRAGEGFAMVALTRQQAATISAAYWRKYGYKLEEVSRAVYHDFLKTLV